MPIHLSRRHVIGAVAAALASEFAVQSKGLRARDLLANDAPITDLVKAIHTRALVFDPHVDIPFDFGLGAHDPRLDGDMEFDIPKAKRGGIGALAIALFVPQGAMTPEGYADAMAKLRIKLAAIKSFALGNPEQVEIALRPDAVSRIHKTGKLAVVISFLNAYPLGEDLSLIDWLHSEGMRIFGFVHAGNNAFADSSRPSLIPGETWHGLSPLGRSAVERLNELGVLIDISQLSKPAALETIAISKTPVIASHSGLRSLVNNSRNLSDEELHAMAAKGGVVAINAFKSYLKPIPETSIPAVKALRAQYNLPEIFSFAQEGANALGPDQAEAFTDAISALVPAATVADLVDSVDWAVRQIGIDRVAISSDFNHGGGVIGWANEGQAISVTAELVRRGYGEAEIAKLWGENVMNVWRAAQAEAL